MNSCSKLLDVAHCSLLHKLFLLCFGFIGANTVPSAELRPLVVEALLMLPRQALLLLCHLDNINDLFTIMYYTAGVSLLST